MRANADKPFMGLTTFEGEIPTLKDTRIAKNYLTSDELKVLNNIVSGYFDFAEIQAIRHRPMFCRCRFGESPTGHGKSGKRIS